MSQESKDFQQLSDLLRQFAIERDWEIFHTPKNLAMALAGEVGELVAEFQWLTAEESQSHSLSEEKLDAIALEIADVQIYLIRLADVLGLDIPELVQKKVKINENRF